MTQQIQEQLHWEARSIGHAFYDRLQTIEAILGTINIPLNPIDTNLQGLNGEYLKDRFEDINLVNPGGDTIVLMGKQLTMPDLNSTQRKHLASGKSVLAEVDMNSTKRLVLVKYALSETTHLDRKNMLVATPDPLYIYNVGVYAPQIACILTSAGKILDCNSPVLDSELDSIETSGDINMVFQTWHYLNNSYTLYMWNLSLGSTYQAENINFMVAIPERNSLNNINSFNTIFPKTLLITGLLVLVLSISAIRKYLDPLEQLILGTRRIMDGVFNKPVKIKSNDEFQSLAISFNDMALRIDEQIQTLNMMSRIDRMILSSHDAREIINVLIEYGHSTFPVEHIAVISLYTEDLTKSSITFNTDEKFFNNRTASLVINDEQVTKFNFKSSHVWLDERDNLEFLQLLRDSGDRFFLLLPLRVKNKVTGLICLGNSESFGVSDVKLRELRELADRVAVALSNAAWEDKLYYQAHYDAVTGLPNRYLLKDRLDQAVARSIRTNANIATLLIDLDQFKLVNDSLGHTVGDELLKQVGDRLSSCVRISDTLSRFGGDEFVIILDNKDDSQEIINRASHLAQRILQQFTTPFIMQGHEIHLTSSIGISVCPENSNNVDDLLMHADSAMYHAKNEGRGQFRFYEQALNENLLKNMEFESDLRHALERNEFTLMFQPKIAVNNGKIVGVETLLRWEHPIRGNISPEVFIPIAEETGLIIEIGTWVLRTACTQNRQWLKQGFKEFQVSVNLSGAQFRKAGFAQILGQILADSGLPPALLDLEITESITIQNYDMTINVLNELQNIGISVSIDDFGTGYSSMSFLNQFKIDRLKIDKSFVDGIPNIESSLSIINAIIALGHSLGFSVVAEGVETREQYDFLVNSGIDEIQGYYISRPLPLKKFEEFYQRHEANRHAENQ